MNYPLNLTFPDKNPAKTTHDLIDSLIHLVIYADRIFKNANTRLENANKKILELKNRHVQCLNKISTMKSHKTVKNLVCASQFPDIYREILCLNELYVEIDPPKTHQYREWSCNNGTHDYISYLKEYKEQYIDITRMEIFSINNAPLPNILDSTGSLVFNGRLHVPYWQDSAHKTTKYYPKEPISLHTSDYENTYQFLPYSYSPIDTPTTFNPMDNFAFNSNTTQVDLSDIPSLFPDSQQELNFGDLQKSFNLFQPHTKSEKDVFIPPVSSTTNLLADSDFTETHAPLIFPDVVATKSVDSKIPQLETTSNSINVGNLLEEIRQAKGGRGSIKLKPLSDKIGETLKNYIDLKPKNNDLLSQLRDRLNKRRKILMGTGKNEESETSPIIRMLFKQEDTQSSTSEENDEF
ncbi:hypothetical protein HZS_3710 [Henneguya salminicola]|nr:hypothetical protein HZS_3710 [Henneguya salminicola]